ncbi:FAD-dependent oxidoreductase [Rhodobacteraceae bacterium D3-12]|nr:FAD-dependent oxidoreductase [Rhodobacteraceae bacterium D3-12]
MRKIVVVGAGQAGFSLVSRLRTKGFTGTITLLGEEADAPYQRPPLSKKYLSGEVDRERLYFRPEGYYADNSIDFRPSTRVLDIDRQNRRVTLPDETLNFDALVLATGSRPRKLPAEMGGALENLFYVRTLADIDAMQPNFQQGARLLIIGGGYIGLETAAVAVQLGLDVTLLEAAPRILDRVTGPQTADFYRRVHSENGVRLIEGVGLDRLTGTTKVDGAILSDGTTIAADFAIAGVGALPNTDLAEAAALDIENGIKVNEFCYTSDPAIFAIGDCASFPQDGLRLRLESVPNAIDQANVAADVILGEPTEYRVKPWFWSDQFNIKLQIAGLNIGYDQTIQRVGPKPESMSVWYFRNARLIAVDAANDPAAYLTGKRWIEARVSPEPTDIADQSKPLKKLVAK